ncbi:MAG TPA: alginate lyase family protein [Candidatus Binatia bacterium]|nr:alginate lyase family protein [Candidatus Binatia bacterium]
MVRQLIAQRLFLFFAVIVGIALASSAAVAQPPPRVFVLQPGDLVETRKRLHANDASLLPALNKLKRDTDHALNGGTFSVAHKELAPPSGDKHDYMSIAPYWWPNPNTPNGLPYVRRDGEVNLERDQTSDRRRLDDLVRGVTTLALGYFFTGREDYAAHAARLMRAWFLDDATRMNPHLRYAQAVPGRNVGRAAGIIETHNLPELVDTVGILARSKSWSSEDQKGLQKWFDAYLAWLRESPEGRAEAKAQNNHGTWYDVQIAAFALFVDKGDMAKKVLNEMAEKRIAKQIEPDGRQPRELERTLAWSYSLFNLEALFDGASMASRLGINLWSYESPDKRSMRKALDWLLPFAAGEKKWNYPQISGLQPGKFAPFLRRAALRYREPSYENALHKLSGVTPDQRLHLLYPKP